MRISDWSSDVCSSDLERRAIEQEKEALLKRSEELRRQNEVLLQEMKHRVANSLQIIASILMLKARAVSSDETRFHLQDAHQRVMSVAAVQQHLDMSDGIDQIEEIGRASCRERACQYG